MSFIRRKRLFTILIGFIILVGLIGFSLSDRDDLSSVEQFLQDTVGWMQQAVHTPVEYATNIVSNINDVKNVYQENQILKEQLARYQRNLYEVQELRKENQELMTILEKSQTDDIAGFRPIQATISARSPEHWFKQVTINKGKQNGVQANMAVITGEGMIGKVQSASQFTSTVLLLNGFDQSNRISVNVDLEGKEDVSGFILGYDPEREALLLEFTDYEGEIPNGEFVFSSGLGGVFPKGLEIGEIQEMTTDKYGLTQVAFVKPSADLYNLNHVIVVDRHVITSDEEMVEEEAE